MPGIFRALRPTFLYWMKTEVHVYAFSIAANVLLSFYPFLIVSVAVASKFFNRATALSAIDLALNDFFPDALGNFLHNNPPPQGKIEIISLFLLLFTANGIFEPLEVGLNHVWGIHKNRSFLRNQVVSLALIFLCGGLAQKRTASNALFQPPHAFRADRPASSRQCAPICAASC